MDKDEAKAVRNPGGIDFRFLPIVTQAISNLQANISKGQSLLTTGRVPFASIDLNQEWIEIQNMVEGGILPSAERLKEYLQAACYQGDVEKDKIILCISDILRLEEERCSPTDPTLRDILVVLEADQNPVQLKEVFLGKG